MADFPMPLDSRGVVRLRRPFYRHGTVLRPATAGAANEGVIDAFARNLVDSLGLIGRLVEIDRRIARSSADHPRVRSLPIFSAGSSRPHDTGIRQGFQPGCPRV